MSILNVLQNEATKEENCLRLVRDTFGAKNVIVGGSYARKIALNDVGACCGDIDFYIRDTGIARYILRDILKDVIFKGSSPVFIGNEDSSAPGNPDYYKMNGIKRRLSIEFPTQEHPSMDFIFVDVPRGISLESWFLSEQASTLSEVGIILSLTGYSIVSSQAFKDALVNRIIPVHIYKSPRYTTVDHFAKNIRYCRNNHLKYEIL